MAFIALPIPLHVYVFKENWVRAGVCGYQYAVEQGLCQFYTIPVHAVDG
jgi:hypothetical protein